MKNEEIDPLANVRERVTLSVRESAALVGIARAHSNRIGAPAALRQNSRVLLCAAQSPESEGEMNVGPNKANGISVGEALAYRVQVVQARRAITDDPGTVASLELLGATAATVEEHYANARSEPLRQVNLPANDRVWDLLSAYIEARGTNSDRGRYVLARAAQDAGGAA